MFKKCTFYLGLLVVIAAQGCSAHKVAVSDGAQWLGRELKNTDELQNHDFGFALYDPINSEWIYRQKDDKYFIPASNTKILTLYSALHYLADSTEALRYVYRTGRDEDTLIIWGTGDPSLLYQDWESQGVIDLIQSHDGPVYYAPRDEVQKFGPGWAWDDYPYRFQVEKSSLPLYGNRLTFSKLSLGLEGEVSPEYFRQYVIENPEQGGFVKRSPESNNFEINPALIKELPFKKEIPFVVSSYDIASMLADVTGKKVELDYSFNTRDKYSVVQGVSTDTLYQGMMQDSDNFVAEQLLLLCANAMNEEYSTEHVIKKAEQELFLNAPDAFQWFDGSGLSRYNLFTPRSLVWVLDKLLTKKGIDYITDVFPAGGVNATIADQYSSTHAPYVFAKTGTLRNHHCLSGYLVAKSGKVLVFSFMHQNFIGSSMQIKEGMQRVLEAIYEKY